MDFNDFFKISKNVMKEFPYSRIQQYACTKKNVELNAAIKCYHHIFKKTLQEYKHILPINDYLLDYETKSDPASPSNLFIVDNKDYYVFSIEEIIKWIADELSNSNVLFESHFKILSLVKNFRLPRNPYTNKIFTPDQIKRIYSEITLKKKSSLIDKKPELYIFFNHYDEIDFSLKDYASTTNIMNFFEKHGLVFKEKFTKDKNNSSWITKK